MFYWVLPSFTGFYWVLPGFTWFYLVLPGSRLDWLCTIIKNEREIKGKKFKSQLVDLENSVKMIIEVFPDRYGLLLGLVEFL